MPAKASRKSPGTSAGSAGCSALASFRARCYAGARRKHSTGGDHVVLRASCSIAVTLLLAKIGVPSICLGLPLPEQPPRVSEVPPELREKHKLDPFYAKYTDYKGYPI